MRLLTPLLLLAAGLSAEPTSPLRFEVSWPKPMDGHVVLIVSSSAEGEPRFQVNEGLGTQQMFGVDAENARTASIDGATLGYPANRSTVCRPASTPSKPCSISTRPSTAPMAAR